MSLPNERVSIEDGRLHIDGKQVSEPPVFEQTHFRADGRGGRYGLSKKKEYSTVPEDHYYILADEESEWPDSRVIVWLDPRDASGGP